jgi:cell division protein FtsI/penicillin-binding protein 2
MRLSVPRVAYVTVFLAVTVFAVITLRTGIPALVERERLIREKERTNFSLAQDVERKRDYLRRIQESPSLQELIIRERLKLVAPRDKVYVTDHSKK